MNLTPETWALVGVGLGWALNEFSAFRIRHREDRKPIGRALSLLLEIHNSLFYYESCRRLEGKTDLPMAKRYFEQMKVTMPQIALSDDELEKAYNSAVDEVATVAPLLAFELRHKFKVRTLFTTLHPADAVQGSPEAELASAVGGIVAGRTFRAFEEVLLSMAKRYSWKEYRDLKCHFAELRRRLENLPPVPTAAQPCP